MLLPVRPEYCINPVKFLNVSKTAEGAPEGDVVKEIVYDPAAVLLQLTVAFPDEVATFPVAPSIVAITHGLYNVLKSVPPSVGVPVNAGLLFVAYFVSL